MAVYGKFELLELSEYIQINNFLNSESSKQDHSFYVHQTINGMLIK